MKLSLNNMSIGINGIFKEFRKIAIKTKSGSVYCFERQNNYTYLLSNNNKYVVEGLFLHTHKTNFVEDSKCMIDTFEITPSVCFWGVGFQSRITSPVKTIDVEYIDGSIGSINVMVLDPYDLERALFERGFFGTPGKMFYQSNGTSINTMPKQGIKLHISARNYADYVEMLKKLVPILQGCDMTFKVVKPTEFNHFMPGNSRQQGKFITIYPCHCNIMDFLIAAKPILCDGINTVPIFGDTNLYGRVYARFGSMIGPYVYGPNGEQIIDDRNKAFPTFISGISIYDFINAVQ